MVVKKKGFYNISLRKTNIARLDSMLETKFLHFASNIMIVSHLKFKL